MLPLRARVDLGAMAIKGYFAFPNAPVLLELHHQMFSVISRILIGGGVLPLCRGAVSVFYSPSQLGKKRILLMYIYINIWRKNFDEQISPKVINLFSRKINTITSLLYTIIRTFKCDTSTHTHIYIYIYIYIYTFIHTTL